MMEKKETIEFINKILVTENAKAIGEDDLLIASELDSFGYAILFIELGEKFNCFDEKYVNTIDYKTYSMKDILNRINQCS